MGALLPIIFGTPPTASNGFAPPQSWIYSATRPERHSRFCLASTSVLQCLARTGEGISGGSRARLLEFGNGLFDSTTDNFLSTVGFKGDKLFDGSWGYDGGFRYNNVKVTQQATVVWSSRFSQILNQNSDIFAPGEASAGGVAFNPFGDAQNGPPIPGNAADVAYATVHPKDVDTSEMATLDLNIYTTG